MHIKNNAVRSITINTVINVRIPNSTFLNSITSLKLSRNLYYNYFDKRLQVSYKQSIAY